MPPAAKIPGRFSVEVEGHGSALIDPRGG